MRTRALTASLIVNAVLVLAVIGWVAWIVAEPRYWFPDAYAEQVDGASGGGGLRGGGGGIYGPGPTTEDAISDLSAELEDVAASVADVESRVDELESGLSLTTLQSQVDELESQVATACDAIGELTDYVTTC